MWDILTFDFYAGPWDEASEEEGCASVQGISHANCCFDAIFPFNFDRLSMFMICAVHYCHDGLC